MAMAFPLWAMKNDGEVKKMKRRRLEGRQTLLRCWWNDRMAMKLFSRFGTASASPSGKREHADNENS